MFATTIARQASPAGFCLIWIVTVAMAHYRGIASATTIVAEQYVGNPRDTVRRDGTRDRYWWSVLQGPRSEAARGVVRAAPRLQARRLGRGDPQVARRHGGGQGADRVEPRGARLDVVRA